MNNYQLSTTATNSGSKEWLLYTHPFRSIVLSYNPLTLNHNIKSDNICVEIVDPGGYQVVDDTEDVDHHGDAGE